MLASSTTKEDDLLTIWSYIDHSIVCVLQIEQYSNRPGTRVVCFGEHKALGGTLTQPRPDAFGMLQQSGEYFAPNPMLSCFGMDFAIRFWGENQKNKKIVFPRKILGYLVTFTRSVLLFDGKTFVVTCFWANICWSACPSTKVYSRLVDTTIDLGRHGPKCPPVTPVLSSYINA